MFCPAAIQPHTSVYNGLYSVRAVYTAHAIKQCTRLYRRFSGYLPCFAAVVWRVHPSTLHCLRHAGAYHSAATPPAHTRYQTPRRTLYRSTQPPYYNNVIYKGVAVRPLSRIHARQCSRSQTIPSRRGQLLSSADRWQVLHPAHLLRGQRLHLYRVGPAACNLAPGQRSGRTGSVWHPPPGGAAQRQGRGTTDGYRRISFGLSPDS